MQIHRVRLRQRWLFGLTMACWLSSGLGLSAPPAAAATRVVTSLADPGTGGCTPAQCTLREAIAAAQPGDTITFAPALFVGGPGTITLTVGELVLAKDLTLIGPGQYRLAISGNQASRVMRIDPGAVVRLRGLTIMGGRVDGYGGGIWNVGTLTLHNTTIRDNVTLPSGIFEESYGGGLYNQGTLTLHHSTVRGNAASPPSPYIKHGYGGGLANAGTMTLHHCTIDSNTAVSIGGGLSNHRRTLTVHHSTIRGNTAASAGGFGNVVGSLTVHHSTIRGNTAIESGGGIQNGGTFRLWNSTISGNRAGSGGGLRNTYGDLRLSRSTVSGNRAGSGGGLWIGYQGTVRLRHSIIAGNTIRAGGSGPDCDGPASDSRLLSRGYNLVGADTGCPHDPRLGDRTVAPATVFTQVLGPLQDNGGPTLTHALLPGSPALDAVPVGTEGCGLAHRYDQRGVSRPQGEGCDIGAVEQEVP